MVDVAAPPVAPVEKPVAELSQQELATKFAGKSLAEIAAATGTPLPPEPTPSNAPAEPQEPAAPQATPQAQAKPPETLKIQEAPAQGANPFEPYVREFNETGKLSDKAFGELSAKGYPKEVVEAYIEGRKAVAEKNTSALLSEIGVTDYAALAKWGTQNVPAAELQAFNRIMDGGDPDAIRFAISSMNARYQAAQGPQLLQGSRPGANSGVTPFKTRTEMLAAMNDKRYGTDPEYRQLTEQRIGISDV